MQVKRTLIFQLQLKILRNKSENRPSNQLQKPVGHRTVDSALEDPIGPPDTEKETSSRKKKIIDLSITSQEFFAIKTPDRYTADTLGYE